MLPDNGSTYSVVQVLYWGSGLSVLLLQALLLIFGRAATRERHALRETVWAVVPVVLLVWLGLLSHRTSPTVVDGPQIALEVSSAGAGNGR